MKCFVTIILDGINNKTFWKLMKKGRLPFIEELSKNSKIYKECITVFPSATVSGHASISTGKFPAEHGLVGQAWFDRERREYIGYDFELTMPDNWVDASTNLNDEHLTAKTGFEIAKELGLRTFSVDLVRKGADLKMSFIKPGEDKGFTSSKLMFLRKFARHTSTKKSSRIKKLLKKVFPFHVLQHEIAVGNTIRAVRSGCRFGVTWFMESDAVSHLYGPDTFEGEHGKRYLYDSAEDAVRDADEEIEKLYKRLSEMYDPVLAILTDHGQSRIEKGKKYRVDLSEVFEKDGINAFTNIDPHEYEKRTGKEGDVIYAVSGPRMAHIYLLKDVLSEVLDVLLSLSAVEFVFFRDGDGLKIGCDGEVTDFDDFEFGEEYPYAKKRVIGLMNNERCGDIVVSSKRGYQLERSDYHGGHGGLNYEDSTGFALIHSPHQKEEIVDRCMVTDILPEIVGMMVERR
jgi:predicted AlkP superfamily pyrophosphatase or phosphodiesterase